MDEKWSGIAMDCFDFYVYLLMNPNYRQAYSVKNKSRS